MYLQNSRNCFHVVLITVTLTLLVLHSLTNVPWEVFVCPVEWCGCRVVTRAYSADTTQSKTTTKVYEYTNSIPGSCHQP
jgi:hypothetical protein